MMCKTVMMMNAMADATPWVAIVAREWGSQLNPFWISPARAGSPIQPSPREARVMPSWVAEM
jgi:hypothetical protein